MIDTEKELVYFSDLSEEQQEDFRAKSMVFFPDIFGESSSKFLPLLRFLLESYNCVTPSIRDIFSASGQQTIQLANSHQIKARAIDAKLHHLAPRIVDILKVTDSSKLIASWKVDYLLEDRVQQFALVLNSASEQVQNNILVGDAFLSGI